MIHELVLCVQTSDLLDDVDIRKRVDEMESNFMTAFDYMIQLFEKGQDHKVWLLRDYNSSR